MITGSIATAFILLLRYMSFVDSSASPTLIPNENESTTPTLDPSAVKTRYPSFSQSRNLPYIAPFSSVTMSPTPASSSYRPSAEPTVLTSTPPTIRPTIRFSSKPITTKPSMAPTALPTYRLSTNPTMQSTITPSVKPTNRPSSKPVTLKPYRSLSVQPTHILSTNPSLKPTARPSFTRPVSAEPYRSLSVRPTYRLSSRPSFKPTARPSSTRPVSAEPSRSLSVQPTYRLSTNPSLKPTARPSTARPVSAEPSRSLSVQPTYRLSSRPSLKPTARPSSTRPVSAEPYRSLSVQPTYRLSSRPSLKSTVRPSRSFSERPTHRLSSRPSFKPTFHPSSKPVTVKPSRSLSKQPTYRLSSRPSFKPTIHPSARPSFVPSAQLQSSQIPSIKQPTLLPLSVSSSLLVEMGIVYDVMDLINQQRFESIINEWLNSIFSSYSPPVRNVVVNFTSQHLQPISKRRLTPAASVTGQNVIMDLIAAGTQQTIASSAAANVQFRGNLINIFQNGTNTASLVARIQAKATSDPLYVYFMDVSKVSLPNSTKPSPIQTSNWIPAIVGGIVGGLAALFVLFAAILLVKSRRRNQKKPIESNTVSLPIDRFHYTHAHDIDPSRGTDENIIHHDETSSTGTFKTLENLYVKDTASIFSNVDPDILDMKNVNVEITDMPNQRGFIGDLFETSDDHDGYSLSLDSFTGFTPSEKEGGSLANKSETDDDQKSASSVSKVRREYVAPPGRLGIVIDSSRYGPIIHNVRAQSPMENMLSPGDRIIAVDDIDTTRMTASEITKIMAQKADSRRKITVLR